MISSVSFKGNVPFADMIRQPQKFITIAETPAASSSIKGEKKGSKGKKLLGFAALAASFVGLVILAKKGRLHLSEIKNENLKKWLQTDGKIQNIIKSEPVKKIRNVYQEYGSKIYDFGEELIHKGTEFFKELPSKLGQLINKGQEVAEEVGEKAPEIIEEVAEQI